MKRLQKQLKWWKTTIAVVLVLCVIGLTAAPVNAAGGEGIVDVSTSASDKFINLFVRIALLVRGSKALFSSEDLAVMYLESLNGKQTDYELKYRLDSDVEQTKVGKMQCFTLTRESGASGKVVIYLPGGAFVREPTKQHWQLVDKLCQRTGAAVITAVYPKAPTNICTSTYNSLLELYSGLLREYDAKDIVIMGDSAGGTIAVSFTQWLKQANLPQPSQLILYSPMLDLVLDNDDIGRLLAADPMLGVGGLEICTNAWLGGVNINSALVNPISCDYSVLPDITVFCGTDEILVFDMEAFCNNAVSGSPNSTTMYRYDGMYHDFVLYPLSAADDAVNKTVSLITDG